MERNFYIFTFFMLAIVLIGCNFFDKKGKSENEKILKSPPFDVLTDSIRLLPDNADLYKQRAGLLSQKGLHDLATEDFKKAWSLAPDEITATSYASNLMITGKLNDALDLLHQSMKMFPANTDFKKKIAEIYVSEGKREDALALYDDMIKKDSNDFEAWYEKGTLLAALADTTQAISDLEKSYSIQPLQLSGLALANLYAETKNKKTLSLCDALLKADSTGELIDAVFLKGVYYSNTNDYANAIAQFDQCIKMDWKFTDAYIEKGIVFIEDKKPQEAITTLKLATTVSNTDADVYYWLGRAYEAGGNKKEALNNYIRATQLDRNFTEAKEGIKRVKS
jgi:tetratricopeptide (TPR) repeat protein